MTTWSIRLAFWPGSILRGLHCAAGLTGLMDAYPFAIGSD